VLVQKAFNALREATRWLACPTICSLLAAAEMFMSLLLACGSYYSLDDPSPMEAKPWRSDATGSLVTFAL
jgi:hypothetical protein